MSFSVDGDKEKKDRRIVLCWSDRGTEIDMHIGEMDALFLVGALENLLAECYPRQYDRRSGLTGAGSLSPKRRRELAQKEAKARSGK